PPVIMKIKTDIPLLSPDDTRKFVKQVDLACRLLDVDFLREVLEKFDLHQHPQANDFLEDAASHLEVWKERGEGVQVEEVLEFPSRCIACSFGMGVKAYTLKYRLPFPGGALVNFTHSFAVKLFTENQQLTDFGWC